MKKVFILCLMAVTVAGATAQTASNDTLLNVLREELAADFAELQQQDVKPYFMSFRVLESYTTSIAATFGYLGTSAQAHERIFAPQIRVGSPELDNFKFNPQSSVGSTQIPLTDASPDAFRTTIWEHMLNAYDRVANEYRNVQNRLRTQADNEDKAPCFSRPTPDPSRQGGESWRNDSLSYAEGLPSLTGGVGGGSFYYEPPLTHPTLTPEEQRTWEQRLCRISAAFCDYPQFSEAVASLQMEYNRSHLVNTEGAAIVQNHRSYRVMLQVQTTTDDGMVLPLYESYFATSLDSLPAEDIMLRDAQELGRRLEALTKAPIADPFTGPALMSGPASGVFFHEIFGHRLEGHRMKSGGQTFRKMIGERVLPTDFQVYCDPTLTHYGTQPLNGGYVYDDEGTRARRVNNVVDGVLKEFLMSRVPLDSFPESNGHGRTAGAGTPVSRQSNLVVETQKPYTDAQLRQLLRDEARRQGKDYGYLFQSVSGGFTQTGEGNSINSFNVTPLEVYRIYVDGRDDELVRGVDLIGTPLSMFSNIVAGGDTPCTFIGMCGAESGWVPVSATSPMIFCSKIETQRKQQRGYLMPSLSAPSFRPTPTPSRQGGEAPSPDGEGWEGVFQALSDELQRSMDSLRIDGQPAPFIIDYRLQRTRGLNITAILGEVSQKTLTPWTQKFDAEVTLGNYHRTSQLQPEPDMRGVNIPMALDYNNLRRQAWLASDARYKQSLAAFARKQQALQKATLPEDEEALDDLMASKPATNIQKRSPEAEDMHADEMEAYTRRLSLVAREFPELTYSQADCSITQADIYRITSEGIRVAQPQDNACEMSFRIFTYHNINGHNASAAFRESYTSAAEALADSTVFTKKVRKFIRRQLDLLQAKIDEDYYVGPVLFEGNASTRIYDNTSGGRHTFRAWHPYAESDREIYVKMNRKIIDDKISMRQDPTLSTWEGKPLAGYFTADAAGQKPQPVTLIDRGIFRGQLCGITSSLGTTTPTGNLRFNRVANNWSNMGVATAPGVLRIESSKTVPLKKMRQQLLRDAQREGYDHAYIVRSNDGVFRVSVKDGSETRAKNAGIQVNLSNLRHINALSTEQEAVTHEEERSRFSIVGPKAMLLGDIEVPTASPEPIAKPTLTFPLHRKAHP